jgi:hypothetical protein
LLDRSLHALQLVTLWHTGRRRSARGARLSGDVDGLEFVERAELPGYSVDNRAYPRLVAASHAVLDRARQQQPHAVLVLHLERLGEGTLLVQRYTLERVGAKSQRGRCARHFALGHGIEELVVCAIHGAALKIVRRAGRHFWRPCDTA